MKVEQKIVKLALVTNELMRRSQLQQQAKLASVEQVTASIPKAVKALVDHERIFPNQAEKVAEALNDHGQTLALLTAVAGHRNTAEQALGTPTKTAAAPPTAARLPGQPVADYGQTSAGKRFEDRILGRKL